MYDKGEFDAETNSPSCRCYRLDWMSLLFDNSIRWLRNTPYCLQVTEGRKSLYNALKGNQT